MRAKYLTSKSHSSNQIAFYDAMNSIRYSVAYMSRLHRSLSFIEGLFGSL